MSSDQKAIIPEIKKVTVGIRSPRTVTVYPLSMHDQIELVNDLASTIEALSKEFDLNDLKNEEALLFIQKIITDNLSKVLEYICDDEERPSMKELTNNQFCEIVNIVYEVNYEGMIKNLKDLSQKVMTQFKKK
jgi:hypothetical protein